MTANGIGSAAGVGIGTLYDFYPNREAIVVALAEQRLARLAADVKDGLTAADGLDAYDAVDLLVRRIVRAGAGRRGPRGLRGGRPAGPAHRTRSRSRSRALPRAVARGPLPARFVRDAPST